MHAPSHRHEATPAAGLPLDVQRRAADPPASAVPESSSRWPQFGLRTLLMVIAAVGVQLALWRSGWGCLVFMLWVIGFWLLHISIALAAELCTLLPWFGRRSERLRRRARVIGTLEGEGRIGGYLHLVGALYIFSFIATAVGTFALYNFAQRRLESSLQQDLGFTYRRESYDLPFVKGHFTEYAAIETIEPNGPFDRAGFKRDDIIVHEEHAAEFFIIVHNNAPQLFRMLERRRGQSVELTVIRPLATQPLLENCPRLVLTVDVPP